MVGADNIRIYLRTRATILNAILILDKILLNTGMVLSNYSPTTGTASLVPGERKDSTTRVDETMHCKFITQTFVCARRFHSI